MSYAIDSSLIIFTISSLLKWSITRCPARTSISAIKVSTIACSFTFKWTFLMSVIALVNLHFISKQKVLRKKLNLYPMHVFELYTALFMHVLTIILQDLYAFHKNLKSRTYNCVRICCWPINGPRYRVCVLNGNRNNVLIAIFQLLQILSKPSDLYFLRKGKTYSNFSLWVRCSWSRQRFCPSWCHYEL